MTGSVLEAVRSGGVVAPGQRFLALVSGGRDSVCLLDVLATLAGPERVRAFHLNYGLRGEESDGDERHVRELCAALDVALHVEAAPAAPPRGNLQAWARDLRYARASLLASEALIATGHTATDQAETIVYRLAASPGRRALLGMSTREGRLVRPLLGVTREQTEAHCRERGLRWREDSSNGGARFARARVRNSVMPALRTLHPAAEANALRTAEILRAEAAVLDDLVAETLRGRRRIECAELARLRGPLARLVVIRLAEDAAGAAVPGVGARVAELLALAPRGGSASLDVGGGVRALVEYGVLRFEPAVRAIAPRVTRLPIPGSARFGAWTLSAELGTDPRPAARGHSAALDADALGAGALTVRSWRAGDRMRPLGLGGSKALSDLFADRRVPRAERGAVPVVLDGEEIAWIPGVATADRLRAGPSTRRLALLRAQRL